MATTSATVANTRTAVVATSAHVANATRAVAARSDAVRCSISHTSKNCAGAHTVFGSPIVRRALRIRLFSSALISPIRSGFLEGMGRDAKPDGQPGQPASAKCTVQ